MSSGVKCNNEVVDKFNEIKLKHIYRYVLMGLINNNTEIGVLKCAPVSATYEDFLKDLDEAKTAAEGRYAVYDCQYSDGTQMKTKLVFVFWNPTTLPIRQKMIYASSKAELKKKLVGVSKELQANEDADLDEANMIDLAKKGDHGCA